MDTFHLRNGDEITLDEGATSRGYLVRSGSVETGRRENGSFIGHRRLGPNEAFGHFGNLLSLTADSHVRALEDSMLEAVGLDDLTSAMQSRPDMLTPAARMLLELVAAVLRPPSTPADDAGRGFEMENGGSGPRLRDLTAGSAGSGALDFAVHIGDDDDQEGLVQDYARIQLTPNSDYLRKHMPKEGMQIDHLPFRIGRSPEKDEEQPRSSVDLALQDKKPFSLSRCHFSIDLMASGLFLCDQGSHLGTIVNGERIGMSLPRKRLALRPGVNDVVAGKDGSEIRFQIDVTVD